jgi:hypothetical protein
LWRVLPHFSWFYTPSIGQWALVSGQPTEIAWSASQYGSFRVPSTSNSLSTRWDHSASIDVASDIIYVVSGVTDSKYSLYLSDVMAYNIGSAEWSWIGGENQQNPTSVYPSAPGGFGVGAMYHRTATASGLSFVDPSGAL